MKWSEVIQTLTDAGYTQSAIAKACGCAQSVISDIARGANTDPRYSIAAALRRLETKAKRKLARTPSPTEPTTI